MGLLIYLFIAFIVHFFVFKKFWGRLQHKMKNSDTYDDVWVNHKEGLIIIFVPIFWIIALPFWILWTILEYVYDKINNKKEDFNNTNNIKNNKNEEFF